MATIRIATFNAENLFARYKFNSNVDPAAAVRDGWNADARHFDISDEPSKTITARAIKELKADVIALQEIENLDTLKRFRSGFLGGFKAYPHAVAIDGNDPRLIDVAVLSRLPLVNIRTHQHLRDGPTALFSRDCLELDVVVSPSKTVTLYVNHLKSMLDKKDACHGRAKTRAKRLKQAQAVKQIVIDRFGQQAGRQPFIILGDLNDYLATDVQGTTGIDDLAGWDQVVNVVDRLPEADRWTHFFKGRSSRACKLPAGYHQLDYLLVSKSLAAATARVPEIERRGMPTRADRFTGARFPGVGKNEPKASDHCPVVMQLTV
ncbi:MAG: endonuclease/exonuclease/phosphatase family protein [Dehalococcoidia bacterium]